MMAYKILGSLFEGTVLLALCRFLTNSSPLNWEFINFRILFRYFVLTSCQWNSYKELCYKLNLRYVDRSDSDNDDDEVEVEN